MKKFLLLLLASSALSFQDVRAEEDMFGVGEDILGESADISTPEPVAKDTLSSYLSNRITQASARSINKAEKVYCYTVDYAPAEYDGYTIDDLAVKGFCGELSTEGRNLMKEVLLQNNSAYSNSVANCQISPKIVLRYVYGLEHTDVLLSDTCPSLTFFHGRDITTVNATPGAAIIEKIVGAYTGLEEKFYSPALLGQTVGNGQPQTQAQKEIIRLNAPAEAPRKKWSNATPAENQPQEEPQQPKKSGWNKLK
ncbi:MAG: hypothetical protein IKN71_00200 [Alphaproteobacteria bacterium]|nr:hypothetical protein [Alphaproteobacteria bacterium]